MTKRFKLSSPSPPDYGRADPHRAGSGFLEAAALSRGLDTGDGPALWIREAHYTTHIERDLC